jgi:hypothetical protein
MNSVTRFNAPPPPAGTQSGFWTWNGTSWQCNSDFDSSPDQPPWCPPPSFPPGGCPPWFPPPQGQPPWYPGANAGVSFGQTAPVNPVRGHFWWDGRSLWMFDGAVWVTVGGSQGTPVSATPPPNPTPGQQWFNGTTLFVWDGVAWVPVSQTKSTISPTAPPSPSPGDTWWDGTQMRIWDGTGWELVGPGATVGPVATTTKAFQLTLAASPLALGAPSTWNIVPFTASPSVDIYSGWDPATHKFKPLRAGFYEFFIIQYLSAPGQTQASHSLQLNDPGTFGNSAVVVAAAGIAAAGQAVVFNSSGIVHLNGSTDYVRLWGLGTDGNWFGPTAQPTILAYILP